MKKNGKESNLNFIEEAARKMGGRDDASLLRQMEEAQQEWEREKQENPEEAAAVERMADQQFAAIMARLKAENAKPVSREEYERRKRGEEIEQEAERQMELQEAENATAGDKETAEAIRATAARDGGTVIAIPKKNYRKAVIIAAVAATLIVGTSVVAIGKPQYHKVYLNDISKQTMQVRYNTDVVYLESQLEEAYKDIKKSLDISVMTLWYVPEELKFEEVVITDRAAVLKFSYGDQWLYLKEKKEQTADSLNILISDRKSKETIHNDWLNADFSLEENVLNDDTIEYSIVYKEKEVSYYLSAIIEKSVFVEIAENLILVK